MPKNKAPKNPYVIDTKMFMNEWYQAVNAAEPKTMAELVAILQVQCDADPKNAGEKKVLTEAIVSGKMNYYRRSWKVDLTKPALSETTGGDRAKLKNATIARFREANLIDPPEEK